MHFTYLNDRGIMIHYRNPTVKVVANVIYVVQISLQCLLARTVMDEGAHCVFDDNSNISHYRDCKLGSCLKMLQDRHRVHTG